MCNGISEIQRLTKSVSKGHSHNREIGLSLVDGTSTFNGKCFNCRKACGYRAEECRECKGDFKGGRSGESEGGILAIVAPIRCVISVG